VSNSLWQRIEAVRDRWNVLEHPFYQRWSAGELTGEELAHYAGEYRHAVVAIACLSDAAAAAAEGEARSVLSDHAAEERAHVELWDRFRDEADGKAQVEPAPETSECVGAWTQDELLPALVALYAIESGQPEISRTKLEGLTGHYGFDEGPAIQYFSLHAERDLGHAAEARELIEARVAGADETELVGVAESVFRGNWTLLDGVERAFGR
jgi:pyrroloquinoline-quinone synthase